MIKTIFIFIAFGIFAAGEILSQAIYFNKTYDFQGENDLGISVKPTTDGGYLLAGETVTSLWRGFRLIKTNSYGDTLWTKLYKKDSIAYAINYMIPAIGGGYAICGNYIDIATNNWDGFLIRITEWGDTVWTKKIGGQYDESFYYLIQDSNGDFVMVSNTNAPSLGNQTDIYMVKTDSVGNVIFQKNYGGIGGETALSVINTQDGGYLLVGYTNSYGAGSYDVYVVKTDSAGNKQWQKTFGDTGSDGAGGICKTNDGNYIITGGSNLPLVSRQGYVIKIDSNGNKIWEKLFGRKGYDSYEINPLALSDGNFLLGGFLSDTVPPNNTYGWLMKLSNNGDSLWSRTFKIREAQHYFTDIKPTADAGFIISGYVFPDSTNNTEDMWLIKVDSLGCDTAGCWITDVKEDLAVGSGNRQLMIYPNPFSEYAYIKVNDMFAADSEVRIVDVTGRIIKTYRIFYPQQTEIISAGEIGTGIFIMQLVKNGVIEVSQKIFIIK